MEGKQKHGEFSVIIGLVGDWLGTMEGLDGDAFPGSWNVWKVHEVRRREGREGRRVGESESHSSTVVTGYIRGVWVRVVLSNYGDLPGPYGDSLDASGN